MKTIKFVILSVLLLAICVSSKMVWAAGTYPIPKEDQFATYKIDLNADGKLETVTTFRRAVGWFNQNGKKASNFEVAIRLTQPSEEGKPSRVTIYQTSFTKIPNPLLGEGGIFSARLIHPYYPDFTDLSSGPYPTFLWEINGRKGLCVGVQITGGYNRDVNLESFDQLWSYVPVFFTFTDGNYKLQYSHPSDTEVIEKFRGYASERFNNRIPLELIHKNPPASQLILVNKDKSKNKTQTKVDTSKTSKTEQKKTETNPKDVKNKKETKVEAKPKNNKKVDTKKPADKKEDTKKPEDKKAEEKDSSKEEQKEKPKEPPKDDTKEPDKPAPDPDKEPKDEGELPEGN